MELFGLTMQQMFVMLLYMLAGFVLFRTGVITRSGSRDLAGVLVKLVIPAVLIQSFCVPFSMQRLTALGQGTALAVVLLLLSILVARTVFRKNPLAHFGAAFSNAGFMGIPLVTAVLGAEAVLYVVPLIALLNLLQWTYGVDVICERRTLPNPRALLLTPPMIGITLGLLLFFTDAGTKLPSVASSALEGVCALNTPLAMMVLGTYLAQERLQTLFTLPSLYVVCGVRLVLIPVLSVAVASLLPFGRETALAVCICAAAPVGANAAVYAQLHGKNYAYAGKMVVLSTLFSLFCLPMATMLAGMLL